MGGRKAPGRRPALKEEASGFGDVLRDPGGGRGNKVSAPDSFPPHVALFFYCIFPSFGPIWLLSRT